MAPNRIRVTIGVNERTYQAVKDRAAQEMRTITGQLNYDLERLYGLNGDEAAELTEDSA